MSGQTVALDNRGLEPPEPMVRILEATAGMGDDDVVVAHNDREPLLLYPRLAARGFSHSTERQADGTYLITIRRSVGAKSVPAAEQARA